MTELVYQINIKDAVLCDTVDVCIPSHPVFIHYIEVGRLFYSSYIGWSVGLLCFTSHRQRGHLETEPPFTVPSEGRGPMFLHRSHRESNPGPSRGSPSYFFNAAPIIQDALYQLQESNKSGSNLNLNNDSFVYICYSINFG